MLANLTRRFRKERAAAPAPAIPDGKRVYAVGDIHGRLDLLDALLDAIATDDAARGEADTHIVLLGDLVDRGPDSRGVVERARQLATQPRVTVLGGNHEDMFLLAFRKPTALRSFLRYGGRETLESYGITAAELNVRNVEQLQGLLAERVPREHRDFIDGLPHQLRIGDYLFVHAGIDPERPLDDQRPQDMRWIREPFLSHAAGHGAIVVHGHTIVDEAEMLPNRIALDTGAFESGRLTALMLEGTARTIIATRQDADGTIHIETREV